MTSTRERRVAKELQDIHQDRDKSGVYAAPVDSSSLTHLKGTFPAPPDTPYSGGTYQVDIQIPENYPFKPPVLKFDTKIWHPNVSSQTGAICLDTLGSSWSPIGTIKMSLISLRMLLESPNPKDPQDAEVAKMMLEDPDYFRVVAHDWAVRHAGAPRREPSPEQYRRGGGAGSGSGQQGVESGGQGGIKGPEPSRYQGFPKPMVDRFVSMGFDIDAVVDAMVFVGIDRNDGIDYEMEEAYMGDITARLLGEP